MCNKDQDPSMLDTTEEKIPKHPLLEHLRKFCIK